MGTQHGGAETEARFVTYAVENYFNYFTEVEERYQRRRATGLLLSTIDWALIETWKDAGVPLEAVLRGIDATFDKYDRRPSRTRKINSLAYCAQEVLAAAEEMKEAAVGAAREEPAASAGLEPDEIAQFFTRNAEKLRQISALPAVPTSPSRTHPGPEHWSSVAAPSPSVDNPPGFRACHSVACRFHGRPRSSFSAA